MKSKVALAVLVIMLSGLLMAQQKEQTAAQESAQSWLALVDKGDYTGSWNQAATTFKKTIPQDAWGKLAATSRGQFGKVLSRKFKSAEFKTSLPGAPDGKYFVIQYETSFENKKAAVETITPMLDKDGHWRVSGYFIR